MTRFTTLGMLALATSAFALPQNHGYGHVSLHHTGTDVHPSASGLRSHHLPSGTKASSVVKPKSKSKSHSHEHESKSIESTKSHESKSLDAITASHDSVPTAPSYKQNGVNTDADSTCTDQLTITTKIQVTVTVTEQRQSSEAAVSSAYNVDHHDNPLPEYTATSKEHAVSTKEHPVTSKKHHGASASASVSHKKHSSHASSSKHHSSHVSESHKASSEAVKSSKAVVESHSSVAAAEYTSSVAAPAHSSVPTAPEHSSSSAAPEHTTAPTAPEHTTAPMTSSPTIAASSHAAVVSSVQDKAPGPVLTPIIPTTSVIAPSIPVVASSKTSTSQTAAASVASGSGKRGLAYNDASLLTGFANNPKITWAWNWYSSGSVPAGITYIPTLWGLKDSFTKVWKDDATKAIAAGSTHIFSFNEPDHPKQANLTVPVAASNYKTYISDEFGGAKTKLCSPAVTNGGDAMGLNYLKAFLDQCKDCQIDCINIHWYGTDEGDLEKHIDDTIAIAGTREIFLSEFGLNGVNGAPATQDAVSAFLTKALPYLDNKKEVTGYSYFMIDPTIITSTNKAGGTYLSTTL